MLCTGFLLSDGMRDQRRVPRARVLKRAETASNHVPFPWLVATFPPSMLALC